MTIDTWVALGIAAVPIIFYAGGFFMLTRNHLYHMGESIKALVRGQRNMAKGMRNQDKRIGNIETAMMIWTGERPMPGQKATLKAGKPRGKP